MDPSSVNRANNVPAGGKCHFIICTTRDMSHFSEGLAANGFQSPTALSAGRTASSGAESRLVAGTAQDGGALSTAEKSAAAGAGSWDPLLRIARYLPGDADILAASAPPTPASLAPVGSLLSPPAFASSLAVPEKGAGASMPLPQGCGAPGESICVLPVPVPHWALCGGESAYARMVKTVMHGGAPAMQAPGFDAFQTVANALADAAVARIESLLLAPKGSGTPSQSAGTLLPASATMHASGQFCIVCIDVDMASVPFALAPRLEALQQRTGVRVETVVACTHPWPTSELIRCIPERRILLEGMLSANAIMFETFADTRNFCDAVTQILGLMATPTCVERADGKRTRLTWELFGLPVDDHVASAGSLACLSSSGLTPLKIDTTSATTGSTAAATGADDGAAPITIRESASGGNAITIAAYTAPGDVQSALLQLSALETLLDTQASWKGKVTMVLLWESGATCDATEDVMTLVPAPAARQSSALAAEPVPSQEPSTEAHVPWRLAERVGRLTGKYSTTSWSPVRIVTINTAASANSQAAATAVYARAAVGMFTPVRAGVCLAAFDYLLHRAAELRRGASSGQPCSGVACRLLYSEFAGGAALLDGAIVVNPHNVVQVAEAMHQALSQDDAGSGQPAEDVLTRMLTVLHAHDSRRWSQRLCATLTLEQDLGTDQGTGGVTAPAPAGQTAGAPAVSGGTGVSTSAMAPGASVAGGGWTPTLDITGIERYITTTIMGPPGPLDAAPSQPSAAGLSTGKRLIVLEYNGVLVPFRADPELAAPDADALALVRELSEDSRNCVWILASESQALVQEWFAGLPINVAAEDGFAFHFANGIAAGTAALTSGQSSREAPAARHANANAPTAASDSGWTYLVGETDKSNTGGPVSPAAVASGPAARSVMTAEATTASEVSSALTWRGEVADIMEYFTERTPGSRALITRASIEWSWSNSDPMFGLQQARDMQLQLQTLLLSSSSSASVDMSILRRRIRVRRDDVTYAAWLARVVSDARYNHGIRPYSVDEPQPAAIPSAGSASDVSSLSSAREGLPPRPPALRARAPTGSALLTTLPPGNLARPFFEAGLLVVASADAQLFEVCRTCSERTVCCSLSEASADPMLGKVEQAALRHAPTGDVEVVLPAQHHVRDLLKRLVTSAAT